MRARDFVKLFGCGRVHEGEFMRARDFVKLFGCGRVHEGEGLL